MFSVSSYTVSIMTWTSGKIFFNWRTHSTPLMPGRLISIRTTSGLAVGKPLRASSALGYWLTQRKPSARFSTRASVPRNFSLSSTIETEIGMTFRLRFIFCVHPRNRHGQPHERTTVCAAGYEKFAANIGHALLHIAQAVSVLVDQLFIQSASVVLDLQHEAFRLQAQSNPDFRSARVFNNIMDRFLESEENVVAHLRRNDRGGQLRGEIHPAGQARQCCIF